MGCCIFKSSSFAFDDTSRRLSIQRLEGSSPHAGSVNSREVAYDQIEKACCRKTVRSLC